MADQAPTIIDRGPIYASIIALQGGSVGSEPDGIECLKRFIPPPRPPSSSFVFMRISAMLIHCPPPSLLYVFIRCTVHIFFSFSHYLSHSSTHSTMLIHINVFIYIYISISTLGTQYLCICPEVSEAKHTHRERVRPLSCFPSVNSPFIYIYIPLSPALDFSFLSLRLSSCFFVVHSFFLK
ncbi:hypothetical protein BX666DRAFT_1908775 [Dichotomocladium elegans]|nr:hypothetical protein BX666DRAFT_1908775 [Dichotomocladium elegans]